MENIKKNIDEFFKNLEGKSFENNKEVYSELVTYIKDKKCLDSSAYNELSFQERKKYTYECYHLKQYAPFLSKNPNDYYKTEEILLWDSDEMKYLLNGVLIGRTSKCKFFKQFFGNSEEFIKSCESNESLIEYLNKVQSIIKSHKDYSDYDILSIYDKNDLSYLNATIKLLKENQKARDCILIVQKLRKKTNLNGRFEIKIDSTSITSKILVSNTMNGFIWVDVFGSQSRDLNKEYEIKLYMTIKENKATDVMSDLGSFLLEKDIRCFYKIRPSEENDMLTVRIDEINKLDELVNWLKSNKDIYFSNHPFMPMVDGIGISLDDGGSYNEFISQTIYDYIINTKEDLGYESFIQYLNSKKYLSSLNNYEKRLYDKNLNLALGGPLTLRQFKNEYENEIDNHNKYKVLKASFEKLETALFENTMVYDDRALLDMISVNLDEIKDANNYTDMSNDDLLFSYYGRKVEDSSLIDYMYDTSSKNKCFAENNSKTKYYFSKIIERWNNEGGYNKIKEGIRAFRSIALHDSLDKIYSDEEIKYLEEYNYLKNLVISCSSFYFSNYTLERLLNKIIEEASSQFGIERNPKDAKPYALRKCYKKKKELEEKE